MNFCIKIGLSVCPCRTAPDRVGPRDSVEVRQRSHRKTSGDPPGNLKSLICGVPVLKGLSRAFSPIPLGIPALSAKSHSSTAEKNGSVSARLLIVFVSKIPRIAVKACLYGRAIGETRQTRNSLVTQITNEALVSRRKNSRWTVAIP